MLSYIPEHIVKNAFKEYGETLKGAAEAIRIGNGSVTPTYIQYLWVLVIFINICIYVKLSLLCYVIFYIILFILYIYEY